MNDWQEEYAYTLGTQAYISAYSWLYLAELRYQWISKVKPTDYHGEADMAYNQFYHFRHLVDPSSQSGGCPNNDTQYSLCFLDLDKGPIVFSHHDIVDNRYYSFELASMTSDNFGYIGQRTTGNKAGDTTVNVLGDTIITIKNDSVSKAGHFLIAGPKWKRDSLENLPQYDSLRFPVQSNGTKYMNLPVISPTRYVFGIIRTAVKGVDDTVNVNKIQNHYKLTPLSLWLKNEEAIPDNRDVWKPYDTLKDPLAHWRTINRFMIDNPCLEQNKAIFELYEQIGIATSDTTKLDSMDDATKRGLARAAVEGQRLVNEMGKDGAFCTKPNGWSFPPSKTMGSAGYFGDFPTRGAIQCAEGMISNDPEEATYPNTSVDSDGELLHGANKYTMTFKPNELPPVDAFWSLTMYNTENNLVPNAISRYNISSINRKFEPGKGLTLYIQADSLGLNIVDNWLPSPKSGFFLVFRAYLPGKDIISHKWEIPRLVNQTKKDSTK
jgi:hypothetical protein